VETDDLEGRRSRLVLGEHIRDRRHIIAVEVNEAEAVEPEEIKKAGNEIIRIPDFDGVGRPLGRGRDEIAEALIEGFPGRHFLFVQVFELEHDRTELPAERSECLEEADEEITA
jgi:hypothetical protein